MTDHPWIGIVLGVVVSGLVHAGKTAALAAINAGTLGFGACSPWLVERLERPVGLNGLMVRLFIAVWPPEDVVEDLMCLPRKDERGVRFVPPENWHITLRFLGDADPDAVVGAMDGALLGATTARLGPGVDVLAARSLVIPVDGLDSLAAIVSERTAAIGEPPRRRFVGHLTVARVKPHVHMPKALGTFIRTEFDVDEVALVASHLDPSGARYDTIHTWTTS